MDRSPWIRLEDATDRARFGGKASTLARLLGGGLPVVPGWVLGVEAEPDIEVLLAQPVSRWILRSSSPLEDRPGFSAAGLFRSTSADASRDELDRGLHAVLDSAADPRLVALVGADAPVAVLAQPHLEFRTWCTVELRAGRLLYEGWTAGGLERFLAESHPLLDPIVRAAAEITGTDPALLEVGIDDEGAWILQIRPAPSRAPRRLVPTGPGPVALHTGLGPRVHPGDEVVEWTADLEHCPTPLSVLLATTFGRWIAADSDHSPSRIIDGRWHDAGSGATDPGEVRADFEQWQRQLDKRIAPAVRALQAHHDALDGDIESWNAFRDSWLGLQRDYFAMPTRGPRTWARQRLADSDQRAGLEATPSAERLRRWAMLRRQLLLVIERPTPEAIAQWLDRHRDHMLAIVLRKTTQFDRRIAPLPYDGFTPGLDEDPWPFFRALCSEIRIPDSEPVGDELAASILALAETDNDQLLETYALWRSAIRRIAQRHGLGSADDLHFLDIEAFEAWLRTGDPPPDAAAGRALHAAWSVSGSAGAENLQGTAAAAGQVRGPVHCAPSLLQLDGGGIAVVDTLGPADAIAVPLFDGIVCAGGDLLGHASVLCREFGIPCVVGIPGVRQRLARATEVLVDGDQGIVHDLSRGASSL